MNMFPHPECTKQTRTTQQNNNNQSNSIQNNNVNFNNNIQNNNKDFLRPVISNASIPLYYNHENYNL